MLSQEKITMNTSDRSSYLFNVSRQTRRAPEVSNDKPSTYDNYVAEQLTNNAFELNKNDSKKVNCIMQRIYVFRLLYYGLCSYMRWMCRLVKSNVDHDVCACQHIWSIWKHDLVVCRHMQAKCVGMVTNTVKECDKHMYTETRCVGMSTHTVTRLAGYTLIQYECMTTYTETRYEHVNIHLSNLFRYTKEHNQLKK